MWSRNAPSSGVSKYVERYAKARRPSRRLELVLERVFADDDALREHLRERLRAPVVDVTVREVDYVRETMRLEVTLGDEESPDGAVAVARR